ncbi:MAG: hypothetical protein QOJ35_1489 [Solirubrobacteraceae bacterium]|nr:hypothetical protein [Solirubrobacteraceae bacterium]
MCPPPTTVEATSEPSLSHVVRCERVDPGARTTLIRITLALGDVQPSLAACAQLVVDDRGRELRCDALPAPLAEGVVVTLGFAVPATARPLGLELGDRSLALSAPATFEPRRSQPDVPASGAALRDPERRLRATQARLAASREASVLVVRARDEALRAVARAEAAAHDASAVAATLARRLEEGRRRPRRVSRVAAVALACALGPAALLVAILAWPARDGDDDHGVGGVASASAVDGRTPATPAVDPLAARLGIPADYLARYREAAARYGLDWTRLAAVGAIESGHGQARVPGIVSGANEQGATGPAQFLPGTWERFGLDGDGDGNRDPHDPADAIPAMASYLRASGAPEDWRAALRSYNHSDAYVTAVETLAASLRGGGT